MELFFDLFDLDHLNLKDQHRIGRNTPGWEPASPISVIRTAGNVGMLTQLHRHHSFIPSLNHIAQSDVETIRAKLQGKRKEDFFFFFFFEHCGSITPHHSPKQLLTGVFGTPELLASGLDDPRATQKRK
jgi:hypothetical protein